MKVIFSEEKNVVVNGLRETDVMGVMLFVNESVASFTEGSLVINRDKYIPFSRDHAAALSEWGLQKFGVTKGSTNLFYIPVYEKVINEIELTIDQPTDLALVYGHVLYRVKHYKLAEALEQIPFEVGKYVIVTPKGTSGNVMIRYKDGGLGKFTIDTGKAVSEALFGMDGGYGIGLSLGNKSGVIETDVGGYLTLVEMDTKMLRAFSMITARMREAR